jgi:predicted oxidoreductase
MQANSRSSRTRACPYASSWLCAAALLVASCEAPQAPTAAHYDADAIVIGAGISGLSAAIAMGRSGVQVRVIDMNSVPGGHAVLAGGVALVGTPLQAQLGFEDSPELAYSDWMSWTEAGNPDWTRFYAEQSRTMIYDWLTGMGAEFVRASPENSSGRPRFHFTQGRAVHLILPMVRTALTLPSVSFQWNTRVERLVIEGGRVSGVALRNLRTGQAQTLRAPHIVLATGGLESNLERVLSYWTEELPVPDRLLIGSAPSALGSGHDLAAEAGAALTNLDRRYVYINGLASPRDPSGQRALTAGNDNALWVNAAGQRFTNELGPDKQILVDLLNQSPSSYWVIFDARTREDFGVRGAAWLNNPGPADPILDDAAITHQAPTLSELAALTGLPADTFATSVARFNALIDAGIDQDFGRFDSAAAAPPRIEQPPFYAVELFPMTRKTMGGVAIDRAARALGPSGEVIPGLYAVGELTGSVGINGKHGMDGMFLGPAILTGRLAGEAIADAVESGRRYELAAAPAEPPPPSPASFTSGLSATDLRALLAASRDGYWHFEMAHGIVLERGYDCSRCHSAELPFVTSNNRETRLAQTAICTECH